MSSHHDHNDHHSEETKPVAFRTPLILGLVTVLAIVLLVSTCDKKHESKSEAHNKEHGGDVKDEHGAKHEETMEAAETVPVAESAGSLDSLGNYIYNLGEMNTIDLKGITLSVGKNSTEYKVYDFLSNPEIHVDSIDKTKGWISLDRVYFEKGKAILTKESQSQIENLAVILKAYPKATVKLGGYTDNTGSEAINVKVSGERATAALKALVKEGIDAKRLKAEGYGPAHPIATNDTPEGMAQNRRVDLRITNK
jgi:OmpA-OmpF porin, OOP family